MIAAPLAAASTTALAAFVLSAVARRGGWVDRVGPLERERKPGGTARPLVGGAAIALGAAAGTLVAGEEWNVRAVVALAAAFALGLVDDLRAGGLAPLPKLLAQTIVGALATWAAVAGGVVAGDAQAGSWLAFALFAVAAQNLVNTFDHADGNAPGLAALALAAGGAPLFGAACLGFLPENMCAERRLRAILGDSGSHLLAVAIVLTPAAWPALLLPALDLARVVIARWRVGVAPWQGDRRHLAHLLQAAGWRRWPTALAVLAAAAPAAFAGAAFGADRRALGSALLGGTVGAYGALVGLGARAARGARACPRSAERG